MTDTPKSADQSCSTTVCCAWKLTAALLLLRLILGAHFFAEGTKKLQYDQTTKSWGLNPDFVRTSEIVFRNATGPFAQLYKNRLPGFYDWENLLAVPQQETPLSEEEVQARTDWQFDYAERRKAAQNAKEPPPIEIPDYAPYKAWAGNIIEGLRAKLKAFTDLKATTEEQDAAAAELFVDRHQQLVDFLASESAAIEEYQHELWRLEQMEDTGGADEIPFRQQRLAEKRAEVTGLGSRLVSEVRGIDIGFGTDLLSVLTPEQRDSRAVMANVDKVLTSPKERQFHWLNIAATCLVIGVGVCMLLGLFTRLAAVLGILFLVSVMLTQLPWVEGSRSDLFFYQLVECGAFATLLASSPWKLPGLDYLFWGRRCPSEA